MKLRKVLRARDEKELNPSCSCGGWQMPKKANSPKANTSWKRDPKRRLSATYAIGHISWLIPREGETLKPSKHRGMFRSKTLTRYWQIRWGICHGPTATRLSQAHSGASRCIEEVTGVDCSLVSRDNSKMVNKTRLGTWLDRDRPIARA